MSDGEEPSSASPHTVPDASALIAEKLACITFDGKQESNDSRSDSRHIQQISPSEFVTLQRFRSSALACKTSTTSRNFLDRGTLLSDLVNSDRGTEGRVDYESSDETVSGGSSKKLEKEGTVEEVCDAEIKRTTESEATSSEKPKLLSRGPIRNVRIAAAHQPYPGKNSIYAFHSANISSESCPMCNGYQFCCDQTIPYTESTDLVNYTSSSSTPDTVKSDLGYSSSSPQHQISPNSEQGIAKESLKNSQLPDDLSDFILKYSREYTTPISSTSEVGVRSRDNSVSDGAQTNYESPLYRILVEDDHESSPVSTKSVPQWSPVSSRTVSRASLISESTQLNEECDFTEGKEGLLMHKLKDQAPRPAKNRLRSMIGYSEMCEAWAWTCKCIQDLKGALCHQDLDGDSLLHIVVQHMDLAKIYALVEQMLKVEGVCALKSFDLPNNAHETPLFLAVQKNSPEVVAYLLEAGANPNNQTASPNRIAPLHYAASFGMLEIVRVLCSKGSTNLNLIDGMGLTPLLCAVKNHLATAEISKSTVDTAMIIRLLLQNGADPMIPDNFGNTVLHYAVDKLDADCIEMLESCIDGRIIARLVNKKNASGKSPLATLRSLTKSHENDRRRSNVFVSLLKCGAAVKSE